MVVMIFSHVCCCANWDFGLETRKCFTMLLWKICFIFFFHDYFLHMWFVAQATNSKYNEHLQRPNRQNNPFPFSRIKGILWISKLIMGCKWFLTSLIMFNLISPPHLWPLPYMNLFGVILDYLLTKQCHIPL
jgi:hypothetical protein